MSRYWCDYCYDKHIEAGGKWKADGPWLTHNPRDHGYGAAEYIDAKDLRGGDLFWTTYRNQPQYLRCISTRPGKEEGTTWILDGSHRSYTVPNTKRIQVQRINDTYTIPED